MPPQMWMSTRNLLTADMANGGAGSSLGLFWCSEPLTSYDDEDAALGYQRLQGPCPVEAPTFSHNAFWSARFLTKQPACGSGLWKGGGDGLQSGA